jgi:hypothetical protein
MKTKQPRFADQQSHTSKKKLFLPIFLGSIMIFSVFAVIFSGPPTDAPVQDSSTQEYAGVLFTQQGTSWSASVNNKALMLRYNPLDVSSSFPELDLTSLRTLFTAPKIYITMMPGEQVQLPLQELYTNLKPFTPTLFLACSQEGPGCEDLPLKMCSDATSASAVFFIRQNSNTASPSLTKGNEFCYTLSGKDERDLLFAIDKLLLQLYGLSSSRSTNLNG